MLDWRSFWIDERYCRCQPHEPCWPRSEEWAGLNASLNGVLSSVRPVASVCHDPTFNETACTELHQLAVDSGWRAAQAGALQHWVWETGTGNNESCLVGSPRGEICHQGQIPLYSAAVESAQDVQQVVRFANAHRLRIVVKNTGHDGAGRSAAAAAVQIHMHRLQNITYHEDFLVSGVPRVGAGRAVTIGAGVMHGQLYASGALQGFLAVGGECPTVGAAGGFLQGGGVSSFFSYAHGLAVDNLLELQVVTADGKVVIANDHQNQDLFWAMRGGGGATFGIVLHATLRVHPDSPAVVTSIALSAPHSNASASASGSWTAGLTSLLTTLQSMNAVAHTPGQLIVSPASTTVLQATLDIYSLNTSEASEDVEQRIRHHLSPLNSWKDVSYNVTSKVLPRLSSALRTASDIYPDNYGILQGSMLVSNRLFFSADGPRQMATTIARLPMQPGDLLFTSNLGGGVAAADPDPPFSQTAMHPAWRSSAHLITFVRSVEPSMAGKTAAIEELTGVQLPLLYSLEEPAARVSYLNLAAPSESQFQQVYWGEQHYARLAAVKRKVDKDGLFFARFGVGSEEWDEDGTCRWPVGRFARVRAGLAAFTQRLAIWQ
ncbi:FAD-linked oxidoreductase easE [Aspergillus homomorphus CBS 101889]|uniref:Chanoclavine-I synthase oxidoreductase protein n=1 Tax=Aspergillus homomorphus (strain CBS 101889) TaxID=1450537 RepID=A0A395I5X1_ASPHC|nr:chanoclavine-I synthase oxidoreductase protein [Aspergillus homomorphus CBS 101889]RAL15195.1 chanoclavine-I synthase oxidoreductase protein [Aspergillus homomorphus CBS 101889]